MAFLIGDGVATAVRLIGRFIFGGQFVFGIADGVFGRVDCVRHSLIMFRVPRPHDASMRSGIYLSVKRTRNIFDEVTGFLSLCRRKIFVVIMSIFFVPPVMHRFTVLGGVVCFPTVGGCIFMISPIFCVPSTFCSGGRRGIRRPAVAVCVALSAGIPVGGRGIRAFLCHVSVPYGIVIELSCCIELFPDGAVLF